MNRTIIPPIDRPIYEGEIASYWMENGILVSLSKSPRRTVTNLTANAGLVKKITGNKRVPLLIYLSNSPIPDNETRKFAERLVPELYSAMAMVSAPGLAKFIMNFIFILKKPPIPMKGFIDDKEAKEWLKKFV
jgi:hypothetical protein